METQPTSSSEVFEPRPTILVVDDERGPRESLRMILAPTHNVLVAPDGAEAIEVLRRQPIDVLTLDLSMPGMSGEEVMQAVHDEFPQTEIVVVTGCGSVESAAQGIRFGICDYLQKPFDMVQVMGAVGRALGRRRARTGLVSFLEQLGTVVGRDREALVIVEEVRRSQKLRSQLQQIIDARGEPVGPGLRGYEHKIEFLEVLAETIEAKDRYMRGHARRVAFYAGLIAERMQLAPEAQERVRLAAFLHDLGKVGVPTDLLLRSGALEPAERAVVERHPAIGAHLLGPLGMPCEISQAIRHHHEWWDGTGYPDGVAGEEIPLDARIVAVADAFDAMSCDRPYRHALRRDVVVAEFRRYAGIQFDPSLVQVFLSILEERSSDVDVTLLAESAAASENAAALS
ncbi:MAG TPA: HD domain-containing phosphohydrolase [Myxococcota bacterium]|nr:HD domain-containing phosphohydrolase [Myxococcota bacterium]